MATPSTTCFSLHLHQSLVPPHVVFSSSVTVANRSSNTGFPKQALAARRKSVEINRGKSSNVLVSSKTDDRVEFDENPEGIISGEWPDNFSLLSYDDLREYLKPQILKDKMRPSSLLGDVMSTEIRAVTVDQTLEEIDHHFEFVSGLVVIDKDLRCIGIVSKKDKERALHGLKSKVGEIMSSPPITLPPEKTVVDAAALMLRNKIHRIPILNKERHVIGMVTRTDIFQALEVVEVI